MKRVLVVFLMLAVWAPSAVLADAKIRGKYEVIGSLENLKGAKQIEMIEFFNYSCGHCNIFLQTNKRLHEKYKDKLLHKKYPVYWSGQSAYPSMAFYITDELGLEEKFTQELFDTNFKMNINIFKSSVINFLAEDFGIAKEMKEGLKSKRIEAMVQKSLDLAKQYGATETPTIIINKTLKVTPSIAKGDVDMMTDNLDVIFADILNFK